MPKCPRCGRSEVVHRSDDGRLCLVCGHRWSAETEHLLAQLAVKDAELVRLREKLAVYEARPQTNVTGHAAPAGLHVREAAESKEPPK
ncbi:MAG: hypothetical protein IMZ50_08020 [Candidatus Atribacteria bacterium]|nr:hypothetical protein [Candidatus Atribacteria bacterium]